MSIHLITVLGTGLYQPICYENPKYEDQYIQSAVVRKYHEQIAAGGRVTILLTEQARKQNWEERVYTEKDVNFASRWDERIRPVIGAQKLGLQSTLKEEFPDIKVETVDIPDGKNPEEMMEIFNLIYYQIDPKDVIVFDVTHGFRSLPFLVMSVLQYAKTMKDCTLKAICYGAFEAKENNVAPIFDLTVYDEIMDWSFAAKQFVKYGNARPMKDVYNTLDRDRKNREIQGIVNKMATLSDTISTSRGSAEGERNTSTGTAQRQSIKQAYRALKDIAIDVTIGERIPPLNELIRYVKEKYSCLDKQKNYEIGMATVQLCIDFEMASQGYTALEETMKTFLCEKCQMDDMLRENRDIADLALATVGKFSIKGSAYNDFWTFFTTGDEISSEVYEKATPEEKNKYQKICALLGKNVETAKKYGDITNRIKDCRNDINHFGMRMNPLTADKLRGNLQKYYNKALEIIGAEE